MTILPGFDKNVKPNMDETQYRVFMSWHWLLILLFGALIIMTVANIWQILVKQERWRTSPLLFFYIFVFLAVLLRELANIFGYVDKFTFLLRIQPFAMQEVGIIQSWMMFELALRLR